MDGDITIFKRALTGIMLGAALIAGASCGANEGVLQSGKETPGPTAEAKAATFESDLADVKRADFNWLYVIRRRDGGILIGEDKARIRVATGDANRRVLTDEGKAIIVGSNYEASVPAIDKLKAQYEVTDLSTGTPPASAASPAASPANANTK